MRILWLLPYNQVGSLYESYREALVKYNIEIELYYLRDMTLKTSISQVQADVCDKVLSVDIVFVSLFPDTVEITPEFLNFLRKSACVGIIGIDEEVYFHEVTVNYIGFFDFFMGNDLETLSILSTYGIEVVYYPFHNLKCEENINLANNLRLDFVYIGNFSTGRRQNHKETFERNSIKINYYGRGSKNGYITDEDYWDKITGNIVFNPTEAPVPMFNPFIKRSKLPNRQAKGRIFEALCCGSFVISEKSVALERWFSNVDYVLLLDDLNQVVTLSQEQLRNKLLSNNSWQLAARQCYIENFHSSRLANSIMNINTVGGKTYGKFAVSVEAFKAKNYLSAVTYSLILRRQVMNLNYVGAVDTFRLISTEVGILNSMYALLKFSFKFLRKKWD